MQLNPTNFESLSYYLPELILSATIVALFLVDLFLKPKSRLVAVGGVAVAGVIGALYFAADQILMPHVSLFGGMVASDPFGLFFKGIILLTTLFIIPIVERDSETNRINQGEFYALLLAMALGGFVLSSASNLLMSYLSLELVSLVSYVLSGYMKGNRRSSEASMKYVIYGGVASGAMVYGMSFLYGLTGSLEFSAIGKGLMEIATTPGSTLTIFVASLLCLAGFGYKIACVPFHMWCPDVYEGAPTPVTAYFSVVPKVAGFAALTRFFYGALSYPVAGGVSPIQSVEWPVLIAAISCATMTLGNLVAIHQNSMKRMLAYSSIAHAGYVLMAFVVLTQQGIAAILFYLAVYFIMNMGAFLVVILVREATGSDQLEKFRGLGLRGGYPTFVAICMTIFLFSLTGIPPTAGFIGKVYLFAAVVKGQWYALAIVGVLNSVVSLYYYARVLKAMFFEGDAANLSMNRVDWVGGGKLQPIYTSMLLLLAGLTLVLGLYWSPLASIVDGSSQALAFFRGF